MLRFIAMIQVLVVMAISSAIAQAPPVDLPDVETNAAKVSFNVKDLSSAKLEGRLGPNYLQLTADGKLATGGFTVAAEGGYRVFRVQILSTASGNSVMNFRASFNPGINENADTVYAMDGSTLSVWCHGDQALPVLKRFDISSQKEGETIWLEVKPKGGFLKIIKPCDHRQLLSIRFGQDGTRLAILNEYEGEKCLSVWDFAKGKSMVTFKEIEGFTSFAISPDNQKLAAGIRDRTTKVYDLKTSKVDQVLEGPDRVEIIQVEFTPDGKYLVTAGKDGKLLFWDTTTWKVSKTINTNAGALNGMALSADSKLVLTAHDASLKGKDDFRGSIRVWDLSSGSLIQEIRSTKPSDDFTQVALSRDGKTLGAYTRADEAYFWQVSQ